MSPRRPLHQASFLLLAFGAIFLGTLPASGEGLSLFAQGSKAMGMAGAFVAQADDPTAVFYNLGGLVLGSDDKKASVGVTAYTRDERLFQGLPPGIGADTAAEQVGTTLPQPHVYTVIGLGPKTKLGIGITTPYFLDTEWGLPDTFAGRTVTTTAEITTNDLTVGISHRLSQNFGLGLGLIYRGSELTHARRLQRVDPLSGQLVDVGSIGIDTDFSDGIGWTVGIKHRPSSRFAWGISYRSAIEIDYIGVGVLSQIATGNDQFDSLLQATLPFDEPLATSNTIEFPDMLSLGIAIAFGRGWRVEVDAEQTGWSSVQQLGLAFTSESALGIAIPLHFDDTTTFRIGAQYTTPGGIQLRFGAALAESPQPNSTVGPLVQDADSTILTAGFGRDWLDLAFAWIDFDQRIVSDQVDQLDGNYRSSAWMAGLTLHF